MVCRLSRRIDLVLKRLHAIDFGLQSRVQRVAREWQFAARTIQGRNAMPKSGDISNSDDAGSRDPSSRELSPREAASMSSSASDAVASSVESSMFVAPLRWLTRASLKWPRTFLLVAVVIGAASAAYTGWCLKFRTNRLDLLNPNSGYNQRWLDYLREFGERDEVVVVIAEGAESLAAAALVSACAPAAVTAASIHKP